MLTALLVSRALAVDPCPATPDHLGEACGGSRPILREAADAGLRWDAPLQREAERCLGAAIGAEEPRALAAAKACVLESRSLAGDLADWLTLRIDQARGEEIPDLSAEERRWAQCEARVRQLDHRPDLCVDRDMVALERVKRRGRAQLRLKLAFDNQCGRPLTCAVTVSGTRGEPANDGVTGVEQVDLDRAAVSVETVTLRFPRPMRSELLDWTVGSLTCRYDDKLEPPEPSPVIRPVADYRSP